MNFPQQQTCIEIREPGAADVLQPCRRPVNPPGDSEVLIRVAAAGVNRPDVFQRRGLYPPPPGASDIPGLEVAGTVIARGNSINRWQAGDRVCALLSGGGYSTHALAHEDLCLPIPDGLTLVEAAALPETACTVWHNLVQRGRLARDDMVLIHGGSSGIGTMAIQVAVALGARVFTTAGTDAKCHFCEQLGAEKAFNYRTEDYIQLKSRTDDHGADVILDMVGGDYIQKNIECAAYRGRIVNIAFLRGSRAEVNFMPVMLKQLLLTGSTLRGQSLEDKSGIVREVEKYLWPLVASGRVRPVIDRQFPLADAVSAHRLMESSQHMGKIVLTVPDYHNGS